MAEFDPMVGKETQFKSGKEAAENGRKGGIASVEARRAKRSLRDRVKLFGELKVEGNGAKVMEQMGIPSDIHDRFMQATVSLYQKAMKGDVAAFNAIRDIIGEKPVDETKVTGNLSTDIQIELIDGSAEPVDSEDAIDLRRQEALEI